MNSNSLAIIADALRNVSATISERLRQEGAGANPPFQFVADNVDAEVTRLRRDGHNQLADALAALSGDLGA